MGNGGGKKGLKKQKLTVPMSYEKKKGVFFLFFIMILIILGWNSRVNAACDCTQEAITGVPQAECEALVQLYNDTEGGGWDSSDNWNQTTAVADWAGVTVTTGNVSSIDLSYNNLVGTIPVQLGNLLYLTDLKLNGNKLTGSIPIEIGNMSALLTLDLSSNQLTGGIPTVVGNLTNLITLKLSSNQLTGGIPTTIQNLYSLQILNLSSNPLGGEIPDWLGALSNLKDLILFSNQLSGNIPIEIGNLSNLQNLSLSMNQLTGNIPQELGNLTNLQTGLYLSNNQLSGEIPLSLGNLTQLKQLYLSNNDLSGAIPNEIGNLVSLEGLFMNSNQFSGAIPETIGNVSALKYLYLSKNQFSGAIPATVGNLANLQWMYMDSNQLGGAIPSEIGNLSNLKKLYLYSNQLLGKVPTSLMNLSALTSLDIRYNGLRTSDANLQTFLDGKNLGWAETQTVPPENVTLSNITETSIKVSWTPISYTADNGHYIVKYSTTMGGGYMDAGVTNDKIASEFTVAGLSPGITYYFVVQAFTPFHTDVGQTNDIYSELSGEVFAMTNGNPGAPEIELSGNGFGISNGDMEPTTLDGTDFGEIYINGSAAAQIFNITNTGNGTLNLTGTSVVELTGAQATDFSITVYPNTTIDMNGGTTSFTISFLPSGEGLRTGTVVIANDDSDESPYEFGISGVGLAPTKPSVSTYSAFSITSDSAQVSGEVTSNGGDSVTERGVCWSIVPNPTMLDAKTLAGSGLGSFSANLTGLASNTLYYAKAYAVNSVGTAYGQEITFSTEVQLPSVNTLAVGSITKTTAEGGGYIDYSGAGEIISRGVCWSTLQNPEITDFHTTDGMGMGQFSSIIGGLSPNTNYYVRAYAVLQLDGMDYVSYGANYTFTTLVDKTGDVNGDGVKDLSDAILVMQILTGVDTGSIIIDLESDVDQNGLIDLPEAIYILRNAAGL